MKHSFAVFLSVLILLSIVGCAGRAATAVPEADAPAQQAQLPASDEPAQPQTIEQEPTPAAPEASTKPEDTPDWQDAPHTELLDLEEVVSCTYTLPALTLGTDAATEAAAAALDTLEQTIVGYAQQTVYPAAQQKQAMGFVNGGYTLDEQDGTLLLNYTISVSYSTETTDQRFSHLYVLDLSTGELLREE